MLKSKLEPFIRKYEEINSLLSSPDIINNIKRMTDLSKEQSDILPIVEKAKEYIEVYNSIIENKSLLDDDELGELAKEELRELEPLKYQLEDEIKVLLIPKDPNDDKNIYLEIRAGTGGDEASLFAGNLLKAYLKYAENRGWKVELISSSEGSAGGFKEVVALFKGEQVYSRLKYESNFKWVRSRGCFIEPCARVLVVSGPHRVSWFGDAG